MVKKRISKSLSTAAVIAAMAMTPLAASAAVYACTHAYVDVIESTDCNWAGDQHQIVEHKYQSCIHCGDRGEEWTESYYEDHSYSYNYDIGAWVCKCGDSYTN